MDDRIAKIERDLDGLKLICSEIHHLLYMSGTRRLVERNIEEKVLYKKKRYLTEDREKWIYIDLLCPSCEYLLHDIDDEYVPRKPVKDYLGDLNTYDRFCPNCGKRLDWNI